MCALDPLSWIEGAAKSVASEGENLVSATENLAISIADDVVDVGDTLVSTGNTIYNEVASGAVAAFNTASGGVVYAVDWSDTETAKIGKYALSASGDIAHFSVELYEKTKTWALDAVKLLESLVMGSPPALGPYNDLARTFAVELVTLYLYGNEARAESIVKSWERDARKKGYTMALDFGGSIQLANVVASYVNGVYVDNKGKWGFFVDAAVTETITLDASATLTVDLYMLFGGVSMFAKEYYFIGGTVDIDGFIVGADALLTSGFGFAGFQATLGIGLDLEEAKEGGSAGTKSTTEVSPTLPSLTMYNVNVLGEQASTTEVACSVAQDSSQETAVTANAAAAMTLKSPSIVASTQVGKGDATAFADDVTNVARIKSIKLRGGRYVDAISITYVLHDGSTVTKSHGGTGGDPVTLDLADDEYILKVTGRSGSLLDQVTFTTSAGRTISAGGSGGSAFTLDPKLNRPIIGVFGSSSDLIHAFGVYYLSGVAFTLQSKSSGLYLDVDGQMSAEDGASAVQESATGGPSQRWLIAPSPYENQYYIINEQTGLYLEAKGSSESSGVVLNPGTGSSYQLWSFATAPFGSASPNGYNFIGNVLAMGVKGASTQAGAEASMTSRTGADSQLWRLVPAPMKVYAFSGGGFTGSFQAFGPGSYDMSQLTIGNDTIRSIRVPDGWRVTLYHDAHGKGSTKVLTRDSQDLGSMSGQVSSITVEMPPWGAAIFKDEGYSGTSRVLSPGRYASLASMGFSDNAVSSVNVPSGWRVTLFKGYNFEDSMTVLTSSCSSLSALGVDNTASSVVVEQDPLPQVVLFKDYRYEGTSQVLGPGRYDMATLKAAGGIGNDTLSSIKVPPNWTVILYSDAGYAGKSKTLTADCSKLDDFNDVTSSLVVIPG